MNLPKLLISVILGIVFSYFGFFAFIIAGFFTIRIFLCILLVIIYVSLMAFLVLWNKRHRSQRIYFVLFVPLIAVVAGIVGLKYEMYIAKIPVVSEIDYTDNRRHIIEKANEESTLEFDGDLPILDGATALYPLYASFVNVVYPDTVYNLKDSVVLCTKTDNAYTNLIEGKVDIIFCAEPSDEQLNKARNDGVDFVLTPIGKEAFVFFVNSNNPVNDLTVNQIQSIYSGKITNWNEIGGNKQSIRAFQRPKNSGSQTMLEKIMGGKELAKASRENVVQGMGGIINEVATYRNFNNAIGYSFLHFATEMVQNNQIKLLSINGIFPSKESIRDNTYLFADTFYAITINKDSENANKFIKWILSEQGQEIIEKSGYVSINGD